MRDLSLHLIDIMQNSVAAGASCIKAAIKADGASGRLCITISDNGRGMDGEMLRRVTDPFVTSRTTRRVGLGIPLFKASAERSGGSFAISSEPGKGTIVKAYFIMDNIDRPPLGSISETIADMVAGTPGVDIYLTLKSRRGVFVMSLPEIREKLGGVPVDSVEVVCWIRGYIEDGIKFIFGGVLNEVDS